MYKRHLSEPSNDAKYDSYNKCRWYQQDIVQIVHNW
uniref:Smp_202580 n=1 Tax=Schistosoma mansoni TaxID=6183 RepID=G4VJH4_SCHMA